MKSWKTSLCGVLALIGALIPQFYPAQSRHGAFLAAFAVGLGLIFARDNDKSSEDVGAKPAGKIIPVLFLGGLLAFSLTGCSFVRVSDPQTGHIVINAAVPAWPWQDSTRTIQGLTATSKTNNFAAKVSGLEESQTTSTNAVALIQAVVSAAVGAAIKAAP